MPDLSGFEPVSSDFKLFKSWTLPFLHSNKRRKINLNVVCWSPMLYFLAFSSLDSNNQKSSLSFGSDSILIKFRDDFVWIYMTQEWNFDFYELVQSICFFYVTKRFNDILIMINVVSSPLISWNADSRFVNDVSFRRCHSCALSHVQKSFSH